MRQNPRIGDVLLVADEGWTIERRLSRSRAVNRRARLGPVRSRACRGSSSPPGPNVRALGTIPSFENVNVYPFVAALLHLETCRALTAISPCSGRPEVGYRMRRYFRHFRGVCRHRIKVAQRHDPRRDHHAGSAVRRVVVELSLRPQRLAEFIGQQKVKDNLRIAIDAALARQRAARSRAVLRPARARQDDARRADRARAAA